MLILFNASYIIIMLILFIANHIIIMLLKPDVLNQFLSKMPMYFTDVLVSNVVR